MRHKATKKVAAILLLRGSGTPVLHMMSRWCGFLGRVGVFIVLQSMLSLHVTNKIIDYDRVAPHHNAIIVSAMG